MKGFAVKFEVMAEAFIREKCFEIKIFGLKKKSQLGKLWQPFLPLP